MQGQEIPHKDYLELELLNHQLRSLEESLKLAQQHIEQATLTLTMLESLKSAKENQEVLVPLGTGTFLSMMAKDVSSLKLSVGANVVVEKSLDEVFDFVQQQLNEARSLYEQTAQTYNQTVEKSMALQQSIEAKLQQEKN